MKIKTWEDAQSKLFEVIQSEDIGDFIYECAKEFQRRCIDIVESNSDLENDDSEFWYDEVEKESMDMIYDKIKKEFE